uniref:Uncharacterized protein n=1 Tax=Rhizophagus irregularis (strain DAOM 181602 / DAOM 197198 / MUCL 43194) TaxID=747089 RepID=U9UE43_RHIID
MLKLKRHYFTAYDTIIDEEDGEEVSENGMKYGRLKIRNECKLTNMHHNGITNQSFRLKNFMGTSQVSEDKYGLKMFKGFGSKQFIDVCVIDRCIGFLKVDNIYYIIDKEVNDLDDSNLYTSYMGAEEE